MRRILKQGFAKRGHNGGMADGIWQQGEGWSGRGGAAWTKRYWRNAWGGG
jgi:hypothetical protein